jgi:hypothetical protein
MYLNQYIKAHWRERERELYSKNSKMPQVISSGEIASVTDEWKAYMVNTKGLDREGDRQ